MECVRISSRLALLTSLSQAEGSRWVAGRGTSGVYLSLWSVTLSQHYLSGFAKPPAIKGTAQIWLKRWKYSLKIFMQYFTSYNRSNIKGPFTGLMTELRCNREHFWPLNVHLPPRFQLPAPSKKKKKDEMSWALFDTHHRLLCIAEIWKEEEPCEEP